MLEEQWPWDARHRFIKSKRYIYYQERMRAEGPKERTSAVYPNINRAPARTKLQRQFAVRLSYLEVFVLSLAARFVSIIQRIYAEVVCSFGPSALMRS